MKIPPDIQYIVKDLALKLGGVCPVFLLYRLSRDYV